MCKELLALNPTSSSFFGPVFYGTVENAPITQNNYISSAAVGNQRLSDKVLDTTPGPVFPSPVVGNDLVNPDDQVLSDFHDDYTGFTHKLELCSGRYAEDIILEKVKSLQQVTLVHLWVIDLGDPIVESWFSPDEWEDLKSRQMKLPPVCKQMARCIAKFAVVSQISCFFNKNPKT